MMEDELQKTKKDLDQALIRADHYFKLYNKIKRMEPSKHLRKKNKELMFMIKLLRKPKVAEYKQRKNQILEMRNTIESFSDTKKLLQKNIYTITHHINTIKSQLKKF